ncbi:hypothetical protein DY000_02058307 [Brassica cretica]|uniref:Uncharacterized protein n=1 Tax=Brassica cretica TaxID=69181 RepID=A0ABQ7AE24_BRACR|nr:hypothetical protein DY000_02058307 [Brassica cretica]
MDLLRQEILKKRQSLSEEAGGKKFYKRSDIEQKKLQKLREEERREHELKAQRRSAAAASISGVTLEDLVQSKFLHFCLIKRRYPTMPSKAVEFNSLANGSDLQSLLAEERYFGGDRGQVSAERLRLMPSQNDN